MNHTFNTHNNMNSPLLKIFFLSVSLFALSCDTDDFGEFAQLEGEVFEAVNRYRSDNNLPELSTHDYLVAEARDLSTEMARNEIRFSVRGAEGYDGRARRINIEIGEGIVDDINARNAFTSSEVITAWSTNLQTRSILEGDYSHGAVGIQQDEEGDFYFSLILLNLTSE